MRRGWMVVVWLWIMYLVGNHPTCSTKYKNHVVFDCTQIINKLLADRESHNDTFLLQQVFKESQSLYYESDPLLQDMFPAKWSKIEDLLLGLGWSPNTTGQKEASPFLILSFPFTRQSALFQLKLRGKLITPEAKIPFQILFSLNSVRGCDFEPVDMSISDVPTELQLAFNRSDIRVAYEYTEDQLDCDFYNRFALLDIALTVLSVDWVAGERLPDSYSMFSNYMDYLLEENVNFLRYSTNKAWNNTLIKFYIHPASPGPDHTTNPDDFLHITTAYSNLVARFASKWASEEENGRHKVILELSNGSVQASSFKSGGDGLGPTIRDTVIPSKFPYYDTPTTLELAGLVSSKFSTVVTNHVDFHYFAYYLCGLRMYSKETRCLNPVSSPLVNNGSSALKLIVRPMVESPVERQEFQSSAKLFESIPFLHIQAVVPSTHYAGEARGNVLPLQPGFIEWAKLQRKGFERVGCFVNFRELADIPKSTFEFVRLVTHACAPPAEDLRGFNLIGVEIESTVIGEKGDGDIDIYYLSRVQPHLAAFHQGSQELQRVYPGTEVILKMSPRLGFTVGVNLQPGTLYCERRFLELNILVDAIITWSYIHGVRVILKEVVDFPLGRHAISHGWWHRIEGSGGDNPKHGSIYVMRNYPKEVGYLDKDPCLDRFETLPNSSIAIHQEGLGCRLFQGSPPAPPLGLQLRFAIHKFSHLEIICGESVDIGGILHQIKDALRSKASSPQRDSRPAIFIELSLNNPTKLVQLEKVVDSMSESQVQMDDARLHLQLSNWEHHEINSYEFQDGLSKLASYSGSKQVKLGLVIPNCTESLREELPLLESPIFSTLQLSHIVCVEHLELGYSYDMYDRFNYFVTMTHFLDGLYFTRRTLGGMIPGVKVYFRFDIPATRRTEDYLRTVRDVNGHAALYNMSYFPVNAFAFETGKDVDGLVEKVTGSWWKVEGNSSDLSNASNYVELESEFLGKETWRPPPPDLPDIVKVGGFNWLAFGFSATLFICISGSVLYTLWRERERRRYLSKLEELEFLNGVSKKINHNDDPDGDENHYLGMRFDRKFEIPKVHLESDGVVTIGAGHFGTVYKALLAQRLVALKVPKEGCSIEHFRSTLQEIKILCHVGCHENLVTFVGAYVKQIRDGIVQLATELCENGSLLTYLRDLSGFNIVLSELRKFCLEIASGMDYLTNKRVIHGDLATRNVLLAEHNTCKIADFGLSRKLYQYEQYIKESGGEPLPWRWLAPEALSRMEFSSKSDVWSYGVTIWEVYSLGVVPYPGLSCSPSFVEELRFGGLRLEKPFHASDQIFEKMLGCWDGQPEDRPTFSELCSFFRNSMSLDYASLLPGLDSTPESEI